ncbi:MAG: hypothetical protein AB1665_06265, partial [Candidatus Thermoplasmatota archaeon]
MNERAKIARCGRGIATAMAIVLLLGTLLPLLGNSVRASEIEISGDSFEKTSNPEPTYGDWTTVYGTVKYEDKLANGQN